MWDWVKNHASKLPENEPIDFSETRWLLPHSTKRRLATNLAETNCDFLRIQAFLGWETDIRKNTSKMLKNYGNLQLLDPTQILDAIVFAKRALRGREEQHRPSQEMRR
jgi:hypothetical protein